MSGSRALARLGRLLVLTDRSLCPRPLLDVLAAAVDGGARTVVLREKDLPDDERARLADAVWDLLAPADGTLVLAGTRLRAPALHLASADPMPAPRPELVGRSCHDAGSVASAAAEGCDWVTVSPVRVTASKPGYGPPLGLAGLASLTGLTGLTGSGVPAYALGGITAADVEDCRAAGAAGVAVMGGVMRAERPDRVVGDLLSRLAPARRPTEPAS